MNVEAIYAMNAPNEPILLGAEHEHVEIETPRQRYDGTASVSLVFLPKPRVEIKAVLEDTGLDLFDCVGEKWRIRIPSLSTETHATVVSSCLSSHEPALMTFIPTGGVLRTPCSTFQQLRAVVFHLLNFPHFFRRETENRYTESVTLAASGWRVALAPVPSLYEAEKHPEQTGGYRITHVGKVEREDDAPFSTEECKDLMLALRHFFSFARGFWTGPFLLVGFNAENQRVWEEWGTPWVDSWQFVNSWFDVHHGEALAESFPGFVALLFNETWKQPIMESVYWYLRSNMGSHGVDAGIILTQAALELLAWAYSVRDRNLLSSKGFKDLCAADQIRIILSSLRIPTAIPGCLPNLEALARKYHWTDGPQAFTEVRNETVHPNHKRKGAFRVVKKDAWNLGQQYVELILLRLCRYCGGYGNRLSLRDIGKVSPVPWAETIPDDLTSGA